MTDLAEFLTRFDAMKPRPEDLDLPTEGERPVTDDDMRRAGAAIAPLYRRVAERAGVDYDELQDLSTDRVGRVVALVIRRSMFHDADGDVVGIDIERLAGEIMSATATMTIEGFCAGILWEQDRHLPDLGDLG